MHGSADVTTGRVARAATRLAGALSRVALPTACAVVLAACGTALVQAGGPSEPARDPHRIEDVEHVYIDGTEQVHVLFVVDGQRRWRRLATTGAAVDIRTDAGGAPAWADFVPIRPHGGVPYPLDAESAPNVSVTVHVSSVRDLSPGLGDYHGVPVGPLRD